MAQETDDLKQQIDELQSKIEALQGEINAIGDSPYLQSSVKRISYEIVIDREEVLNREFGQRIDERHGTMFEVKTQAKRLALLLGLDADGIRIMVNEAIQNILEHGSGRFVTVRLELMNEGQNPCLVSSFKHDMPTGEIYTLSDINQNAMKGDVTSEYFDFESSRGRGEFLMKELTDERRIINGIDVNPDGQKVRYFKRVLINYKNPTGPRARVTFGELKQEIDRLDYEDVVCYFHVHHLGGEPDAVTIATTRAYAGKVQQIMQEAGFAMTEEEPYYRTLFATYTPEKKVHKDVLLSLFAKVRQIVNEEIDGKT